MTTTSPSPDWGERRSPIRVLDAPATVGTTGSTSGYAQIHHWHVHRWAAEPSQPDVLRASKLYQAICSCSWRTLPKGSHHEAVDGMTSHLRRLERCGVWDHQEGGDAWVVDPGGGAR